MPPKIRKSKIISIRISPEEYDLLKSKYPAIGGRSVSALAREAMQRVFQADSMSTESAAEDMDRRLRTLDARVHLLQLEVAQLSRSVAQSSVARKNGPPEA